MPLSIKHPEAERLARILAARTGETITQAITKALEERLLREEGKRKAANLSDELLDIGKRCAALPDLDSRSADDIVGYDEHGLPG